ncbi:hypothetical protein TKK_0015185 [Trichogramma kaykai]|uniref:RRM domain-containing protein n=1 Tax=Trichogramma kaykai TaxID=54128 RepID=A0ABD2WAM7_9HYME
MDERGEKTLISTANEEVPVMTLLQVAVKLGEITDVRTTYRRERRCKTINIRYLPYAYPSRATIQVPVAPAETPAPARPATQNIRQKGKRLNHTDATDRIFCTIPPNLPTENTITQILLEHFMPFGPIEYYHLITLSPYARAAYVKYFDPMHAKRAYENVHKMWKAVFAKERNIRTKYQGQVAMTYHKECESLVEWDTYDLHVSSCEILI